MTDQRHLFDGSFCKSCILLQLCFHCNIFHSHVFVLFNFWLLRRYFNSLTDLRHCRSFFFNFSIFKNSIRFVNLIRVKHFIILLSTWKNINIWGYHTTILSLSMIPISWWNKKASSHITSLLIINFLYSFTLFPVIARKWHFLRCRFKLTLPHHLCTGAPKQSPVSCSFSISFLTVKKRNWNMMFLRALAFIFTSNKTKIWFIQFWKTLNINKFILDTKSIFAVLLILKQLSG